MVRRQRPQRPARIEKAGGDAYYKGFNASGPVYIPKLYDGRNRTFFMTSLELYRAPTNLPSFISVPTPAMRNGDFSGYRDAAGKLIPVNDPLNGQPFPNNTIPTARIYPNSMQYLNQVMPPPNVNTPLISNNSFGPWTVTSVVQDRYDLRLDQTLNSKNNFFFRFD